MLRRTGETDVILARSSETTINSGAENSIHLNRVQNLNLALVENDEFTLHFLATVSPDDLQVRTTTSTVVHLQYDAIIGQDHIEAYIRDGHFVLKDNAGVAHNIMELSGRPSDDSGLKTYIDETAYRDKEDVILLYQRSDTEPSADAGTLPDPSVSLSDHEVGASGWSRTIPTGTNQLLGANNASQL